MIEDLVMPGKNQNEFLVMWSREGLECVIDLTQWKKDHDLWEKKEAWNILKGSDFKEIQPKIPLQMMILRARMNAHRFYEIYTFATVDGISKKDVDQLFESNPQYIVDFIRENGSQIYSDREKISRSVIV